MDERLRTNLVQDVVEGYFDELAQAREVVNSRYDDLKSGRFKPIPGDEVALDDFRRELQDLKRLGI